MAVAVEKRGPYINENEYQIYLPVNGWTLNEARQEAASFARMELGENIGRARYIGKALRSLHDHDDWWGCEKCPPEQTWMFETYEGPWR